MLTTPRRRRRRARRGRGGCALMRATPIYGRERCKLEHVVAIERTTMCMCAREESVGVLVMYVLTLMYVRVSPVRRGTAQRTVA